MSGTKKQVAIHEIRLGEIDPKTKERKIVAPGETFDCPEDDLTFFQSAGACADPEVALEDRSPDPTPVDPEAKAASQGDDEDEDEDQDGDDEAAEAERLELLKEAKDLKIKGIRKDFSAETLREKIAEHKAAQESEEDEDDENEDVL